MLLSAWPSSSTHIYITLLLSVKHTRTLSISVSLSHAHTHVNWGMNVMGGLSVSLGAWQPLHRLRSQCRGHRDKPMWPECWWTPHTVRDCRLQGTVTMNVYMWQHKGKALVATTKKNKERKGQMFLLMCSVGVWRVKLHRLVYFNRTENASCSLHVLYFALVFTGTTQAWQLAMLYNQSRLAG